MGRFPVLLAALALLGSGFLPGQAWALPEEGDGEDGVDAPEATAVPDGTDDLAPAVDAADVKNTPSGIGARLRRRDLPFHGSFRVHYRLRTTGSDTDQDLYQYLELRYRDERAAGLSAAFHGRLTEDLDRGTDTGGFFVFDSITDTFGSRFNGRIYHAWVNWRPAFGPVDRVRIGRQYVDAGELFHVDGAHVALRPPCCVGGVSASAFVGVPAHLFESSPQGDFIGGIGMTARPWRGAEARLDYVHLEDRNEFYGQESNDLLTAHLRQQLGRRGVARGRYQHLNGKPRIVDVAIDAANASGDLLVRGSFRGLLTQQNELAYDIDPFFAVAQSLEPYWVGNLAVARTVGRHFGVEAGVATRRLFDRSDAGRFNRQFERYYLEASTYDWPCRSLSLAVTGELWEGTDSVRAIAFDAEYRPSACWRFQAGTDFALYRFDLFADDERQNSRAVYVRVRWRPHAKWQGRGQFRLENDDFDTYVTLRVGFQVDF